MTQERPSRYAPMGCMATESMDYLIRDFPHLDPSLQSKPGVCSTKPSLSPLDIDAQFPPFLRKRRMEQLKYSNDEFDRNWPSYQPSVLPAPCGEDYRTHPLEALPLSAGLPLFTNDQLFHTSYHTQPHQQQPAMAPSSGEVASSRRVPSFSLEPAEIATEQPPKDRSPATVEREEKPKVASRKPLRRRRELLLPASTRKKNREAQQRFREKQKGRKAEMSNELEQLREDNAALAARVTSLERQISEMGGTVTEELRLSESQQRETPSENAES